jgi:transcription antitermination factor NusG
MFTRLRSFSIGHYLSFQQLCFLSEMGEALSQLQDRNRTMAIADAPVLQRCQLADGTSNWYAVYTSPRHEKYVAEQLRRRSIDQFLPLYQTVHRWKNGCKAKVELPLFPGYVFVKISKGQRVPVLELPGVVSFVGTRNRPAELSACEIETLRAGLQLHKFEPYRKLAVGAKVRIASGALAGLTGVLLRHANGYRVVITVELIHQSAAVELDEVDVEPCGTESRFTNACRDL